MQLTETWSLLLSDAPSDITFPAVLQVEEDSNPRNTSFILQNLWKVRLDSQIPKQSEGHHGVVLVWHTLVLKLTGGAVEGCEACWNVFSCRKHVRHFCKKAAEDVRMFWNEGLHNLCVLTLFSSVIDWERSSSSYRSSAV